MNVGKTSKTHKTEGEGGGYLHHATQNLEKKVPVFTHDNMTNT